MASATRHSKTADHAARAEEALAAGRLFEAERLSLKAMLTARQNQDFDRMAAAIPTLMDARMRRLRDALKAAGGARAGGRITIIDTPVSEDVQVNKLGGSGCYLVQPPQVGADARRLRLAALQQEIAVAVLCREPVTQLRQTPVAAITPGMTLRTKVASPRNNDNPDLAWFAEAVEALGDWAIEAIDPELTPLRRVDALLERLDALPEHEGLHQALLQACIDAKTDEEAVRAARAARKHARGGAAAIAASTKAGHDPGDEEEADDTDAVAPPAAIDAGEVGDDDDDSV